MIVSKIYMYVFSLACKNNHLVVLYVFSLITFKNYYDCLDTYTVIYSYCHNTLYEKHISSLSVKVDYTTAN